MQSVARFNFRRISALACRAGMLLCACVAFYLILRTPVLGVAENADSLRYSLRIGLIPGPQTMSYLQGQTFWPPPTEGIKHQPDGSFLNFVERYFQFVTPNPDLPVCSSAVFFVGLAGNLFRLLNPDSIFLDVRAVGLIYLAATCLAFFVFFKAGRSLLLGALVAYLLIDPRYLLWHNSLYAETPVIISILLLCAAFTYFKPEFMRRWRREKIEFLGIAFALASLPGAFAKQQHIFMPAMALLTLLFMLYIRRSLFTFRGLLVALPLSIASFASIYYFRGPTGAHYQMQFLFQMYKYQSVFMGMGRIGDAEKNFRCIGLPEKFWPLMGNNLFVEQPQLSSLKADPELHQFLSTLGYTEQISCYLRNPGLIIDALVLSGTELRNSFTPWLGNHEREEFPTRTTYKPSWRATRFLDWIFNRYPPLLWIIPAVGALLSAYRFLRRGSGLTHFSFVIPFLVLYLASQLFIITFGDGAADVYRQVVGAQFCLHLLTILIPLEIWLLLSSRLQRSAQAAQPQAVAAVKVKAV